VEGGGIVWSRGRIGADGETVSKTFANAAAREYVITLIRLAVEWYARPCGGSGLYVRRHTSTSVDLELIRGSYEGREVDDMKPSIK
jgi:hypothetical protein